MDLQQTSSDPAILFSPPNNTTLSFFSNRPTRSELQQYLFLSPIKSISLQPSRVSPLLSKTATNTVSEFCLPQEPAA
jgi:hypothetical protein